MDPDPDPYGDMWILAPDPNKKQYGSASLVILHGKA